MRMIWALFARAVPIILADGVFREGQVICSGGLGRKFF